MLADTIERAGAAKDSADAAVKDAKIAGEQSYEATLSATKARNLAAGARHEADSLTQEIIDAKQQSADASSKAADAVSRLAGAEQQLADATEREAEAVEKLNNLKTPRTLRNASDLSATLKQFAGTEYTFSMCFADDESVSLLRQIDSALQAAGWKRVAPSPLPTIQLNIFGDKPGEGVAEGTLTGIEVTVESTESLDTLRTTPLALLPQPVNVGGLLKNALAVSIDPPAATNVAKDLIVHSGSSPVVQISVGKKP